MLLRVFLNVQGLVLIRYVKTRRHGNDYHKKKKAVFMLSDPRSRRHMVHYAWPHGGHQVSKAQREQGMHMQKHWL